MLAELAAANAAFGVIKSAISNSKELADVGKSIAAFVGAEDDLRAKADKKQKSPWNKLVGKEATDFEEFMALGKSATKDSSALWGSTEDRDYTIPM